MIYYNISIIRIRMQKYTNIILLFWGSRRVCFWGASHLVLFLRVIPHTKSIPFGWNFKIFIEIDDRYKIVQHTIYDMHAPNTNCHLARDIHTRDILRFGVVAIDISGMNSSHQSLPPFLSSLTRLTKNQYFTIYH